MPKRALVTGRKTRDLQDDSLNIEDACGVGVLLAVLRVIEEDLLTADNDVLLRPTVTFDILLLWYRQPAL